jgi:hypothetical protein
MTVLLKPLSASLATPTARPRNSMTAAARRFCSKTWKEMPSSAFLSSGEARAGERIMGLRRGFIQAGAQNLLMTLWPIGDEFTVQIMSDFYEAAHNIGKAPEALAEVQRNWLLKLRRDKGLVQAFTLSGPFIMSSQGVQ